MIDRSQPRSDHARMPTLIRYLFILLLTVSCGSVLAQDTPDATAPAPAAAPTPAQTLIPPQLQLCTRKVATVGPPTAAEVLLRNLEACKTAFDLRAWAWQCTWAIGHRALLD